MRARKLSCLALALHFVDGNTEAQGRAGKPYSRSRQLLMDLPPSTVCILLHHKCPFETSIPGNAS